MVVGLDLQDFVRRCNNAGSEGELYDVLDSATRQLGFEQFAMGHHVDLTGPPADAMRLTSYDPDWIDVALSNRFFADDPIHVASSKTAIGFLWSDVPKLINVSGRQVAILEAARRFGLVEGFTVPVHVPGEYRGTCSFGARSLDDLLPDALPTAQLVGAFAFEAARRIMRRAQRSGAEPEIPSLTERQLDCVTLVAQGKTDWEIGRILGISQATAHEHVEAARRRYGVLKRTQLVIRALFDGQITFSDILS